jgi:16S rRNA (adenine1518-N6/adenine1519-N6)-dimethyltransferase
MTDTSAGPRLLGPAEVRRWRPSSTCGRPSSAGRTSSSTPTRCAGSSASPGVTADDVVLEVGPGLGSLTLALLEVAGRVVAVEIDGARRRGCPHHRGVRPGPGRPFEVVQADALRVDDRARAPRRPRWSRTCPTTSRCRCCCTCCALLPSLEHGLVMVQAEVADRLAAPPGSKTYGVPSVKAAWYADVRRAGAVGRNVFWPAPNVDSGLVAWTRREPPVTTATREQVFAVVDAAFAQRRKALRGALRGLAGSAEEAEAALAPAASTRWRAASRWTSPTSSGSPRGCPARGTRNVGAPMSDRSPSARPRRSTCTSASVPARGRLPPARDRLPGRRACTTTSGRRRLSRLVARLSVAAAWWTHAAVPLDDSNIVAAAARAAGVHHGSP